MKTEFWDKDDNLPAFLYAKGIIEHHAKSFSFATQFLPTKKRWATYAVYAFCRYADNIVDKPRNRSTESIQKEIEYLSDELELAYKFGESEHPVLKAFIIAAQEYNIPKKYALELIEGVQMDTSITRYSTFEELYIFCYRVAAVVGLMMTYVLGFKEEDTLFYAEKMGIAMQLTNILRDVKEDKNMNRIYLPIEELKEYKVSEEDIYSENFTPQLHEFMQFQVNRAWKYYEESMPGISKLAKSGQFAIYAAGRIYSGILNKIKDRDYNPFGERVFVPKKEKVAILGEELIKRKLGINL